MKRASSIGKGMGRAIALSVLLFSLILSCTRDAYEKGEGTYSLMRADLVEAHVRNDSLIDHIITDDGDQLTLTIPRKQSWVKKCDTLYRALFYYNKKENKQAEVISSTMINTMNIVPVDSVKKGMKTDPIKLESMWIGNNKRFLNVGLYLKTGQSTDAKALHRLGIVCDSIQTNTDGTRTLCARFYHDQGGIPEYYSARTYLSIPLYNLTTDSLQLTVQTYDGIVTKRFAIER